MSAKFRAQVVSGREQKLELETLTNEKLPPGEVTIRVRYSGLNYKDALASRGHPGVVQTFPHVPGIDAAGEVLESNAREFQVGQQVIVTGFGLGATQWGAYAEVIRVPAAWVIALPTGLTMRQAMIIGTAGMTAAQSIAALEHAGITPERGEIVVTGANGGVGSFAVAILAKLGYKVVAVTGKNPELALQRGAARTMRREEILEKSPAPLVKGHWAGAIDSVGGETLVSILRATQQYGCVTACGLVGGIDLPLTVYPFILRGVSLMGIDSVHVPLPERNRLWSLLAGKWSPANFDSFVDCEVELADIEPQIERILRGETTGRVVVRVD
jgi:acrylyl-CoA reductase (NADPH)